VIVLKNNINWVYMAIGMAVLIALILWGVKAYKRRRGK
jgi:hypothetical protein